MDTQTTLPFEEPELISVRDRIDALSPQQIEQRRNEILLASQGNYESLSTTQLHELSYIAARLRKTHAGPPRETKQRRAKTIDDLLF